MVWTRSLASSSKQPTCSPASMTIGSPASTRRSTGAAKWPLRSASPDASARSTPRVPAVGAYCTSVKPSARRRSSAIHSGLRHVLGSWAMRSRVVSGGASAAARAGRRPKTPTVPASVNPRRNFRRLNRLAYWVRMETSLPKTGQCKTANAGQWTLLPSYEQAQHLTLALTCCRKRARSGRWRQSGAALCSARFGEMGPAWLLSTMPQQVSRQMF
jgi:hypothetical protein